MSGGFTNKTPGGDELTAAEELWVQTGSAGVVLLTEQSSAPGTTAGVGKVYTKTADGKLYFKDGSGTEYDLTAAGGVTILTATGSVNGSNLDFIFSEKPDFIVNDGITLRENKGWSWNSGTSTATMDNPPTFDLWGVT